MAIVTQTGGQSSVVVNGQSLEFIVQQVLQMMAGCPDALANNILQNVLRDFYSKSTGWREVLGPYYIASGVATIAYNPVDQYSQVDRVLAAFLYPDTTGAYTPRGLHIRAREKFSNIPNAPSGYYVDYPNGNIILDPTPDQNYGAILQIYASLTPVINAGQLPAIAINKHFDGLFYGTLARLGEMPNKPWSVKNMQMLNEWKRTYARERNLARDFAERGYGSADMMRPYPNFAGRMSQQPYSGVGDRGF
ncbi:MAG: hypothetical protein ABSD12_19765 [Paraburkholderia sp.]